MAAYRAPPVPLTDPFLDFGQLAFETVGNLQDEIKALRAELAIKQLEIENLRRELER